jgi:ABC-type antimicrobial peptide transport system permease subunit
MNDIYVASMARTSFTLVMLGIAGSMALLLGIVGIYGVMSYAVSQRTREIGIRLALGAEQRQVRRMFIRQGLALACLGATIGVVVAIPLSGLMSSLLFEVSPVDPLTYVVVIAGLIVTTLIAAYIPAQQASVVDPIRTLRSD